MSTKEWLSDGNWIYELNSYGVNKWACVVQPGHDDKGNRTTKEECLRIAKLMKAAPNLLKLAESGEFVPWSGGDSPKFPDGVFIELHFKDGSCERTDASEATFMYHPDEDWSVVGYKVLSVP